MGESDAGGLIPCRSGEIVTPLPTSADGEDDLKQAISPLQSHAGSDTALLPVDFDLCVCPLVAKLSELILNKRLPNRKKQ